MVRVQWSKWLMVATFVVLLLPVSGCGSSADGTANKFVSATTAQKYVEANGYLGGDLSGAGDGSTSALIADGAQPDFKVSEQSDTTAKVVSGRDSRNYMLLSKDGGNWEITEIAYFLDSEVKEPISYETKYTDDPNAWEREETVVTEGQNGEATYKVTTKLLNGQSIEANKNRSAVNSEPIAKVVTRGTKSRSAGWIPVSWIGMYTGGALVRARFRVTEIAKTNEGLRITWESENLTYPDRLYTVDINVVKGSGKPDKYGQIYVERIDKIGGLISPTVIRFADGRIPAKSSLVFAGGLSTVRAADGVGVELAVDSKKAFTADRVYPGPVIDEN